MALRFIRPGRIRNGFISGDTGEVVRFPYHNGDLKASGASAAYCGFAGRWRAHHTRGGIFAGWQEDCLWRSVRRQTSTILIRIPARRIAPIFWRAIRRIAQLQVYAYGIRNAGGGIAVNPQTGELWCSVNERDALGDNLVPDYITHVQEGGFYGWPWWYMGAHQDPRHAGKHPELKDKAIVPDVLLQPHNASLEFTFYQGDKFPAEYSGDIFASEHGSWNKSVRVGYEVIRVPLHGPGTPRASIRISLPVSCCRMGMFGGVRSGWRKLRMVRCW